MRTLTIADPALVAAKAVAPIASYDVGAAVSGWSGAAWTPTGGWATATGNAFGQPVMYRNPGLGTHLGYMEFDYWGTGSGDNWFMFGMCWGTAANAYTDNGYTWLIRGPSAASGANQLAGPGTPYTLPTAPTSAANKVTVGLEVTGTQTSAVYINRVQRSSGTHATNHSAKRNIMFGAYNGLAARIDNVAVYAARPF